MPDANSIRAGRAVVELAVDDRKLTQGLAAADRKFKAFGSSAHRSLVQALRPTAALEAAAFRQGGRGFNASRALLDTGYGGTASAAFAAMGGGGFVGGIGGVPVGGGARPIGVRQLVKSATVGGAIASAGTAALGGDLKTSAITGLMGGIAGLAASAGPAGLAIAGLTTAVAGLGFAAFKAYEFYTGSGKVDPDQAKKNADIEQAILDESVRKEEEQGRIIDQINKQMRERLAAEKQAKDLARQSADALMQGEIARAGLEQLGLSRGDVANFGIQERINRGELSPEVGAAMQQQNILADKMAEVAQRLERIREDDELHMEEAAAIEDARQLGMTPGERRVEESSRLMDLFEQGLIDEETLRKANQHLIESSGELADTFEDVVKSAAVLPDFIGAFSQEGANAFLRHQFGGTQSVDRDQLTELRGIHRELRDARTRQGQGQTVVIEPANV